jgi:hypothetical protein
MWIKIGHNAYGITQWALHWGLTKITRENNVFFGLSLHWIVILHYCLTDLSVDSNDITVLVSGEQKHYFHLWGLHKPLVIFPSLLVKTMFFYSPSTAQWYYIIFILCLAGWLAGWLRIHDLARYFSTESSFLFYILVFQKGVIKYTWNVVFCLSGQHVIW